MSSLPSYDCATLRVCVCVCGGMLLPNPSSDQSHCWGLSCDGWAWVPTGATCKRVCTFWAADAVFTVEAGVMRVYVYIYMSYGG